MGDDFDLFPKRENLDPFSFGKKEKTTESEKPDGGEELFGQEDKTLEPMPDLSQLSVDPPDESPTLPDLPLGGPEAAEPPATPGMPPLQPPPSAAPPVPDAVPDPMDGILSDGPISEEKTFDEPVDEQEQVVETKGGRSSRKSPSPFVVVGGALIIIIGLLYGALTYLKRDKPQVPVAMTPPVSVTVVPPSPEPVPVPDSETVETTVPEEAQSPVETTPPATVDVTVSEPESVPPQETISIPAQPTPKPEEATGSSPAVAPGTVQYSIQVGAFILDSSVAGLEKKLRGHGYDPFLKKGSTTAMMNMLTVGPFGKTDEARAALSQLKDAGVDSNMRHRDDGSAIINAGSYLLEENATSIMKKIRSLGYPVKLQKREAKLPMTFVRVGRYSDMDAANNAKVELKGKGMDGIVVKLQ